MLHNLLSRRIQLLQQERIPLQKQLSRLPSETIIVTQNGNTTKWYTRSALHTPYIYLPKKELPLARQLAHRKYIELRLHEIDTELKILNSYLRRLPEDLPSDQLLADPRYRNLLLSGYHPQNDYVARWLEEPFASNPSHPENLIHSTPGSYKVRSKSEVMISTVLHDMHIPHRYEAPLALHSGVIYPDFTLLHPETHEVFYMEHFGMMDEPEYANAAALKIRHYIQAGFIPNIHLIFTCETREDPLTLDAIRRALWMF